MKFFLARLAIAVLVSINIFASAATLYVNLNSVDPTSPYTNWSTAATDIQDAVNAANPGDTVLVTNGIYASGGSVMLAITNRVAVNKAISVQSVNGALVTIIQGAGMTNGASAVRCAWLTNGASLTGFTLRFGATGSSSDNQGGGVASFTDAIVANCLIYSNTAAYEGGGAFQGTLTSCAIYGNNCPSGGGTCNSILNNCTVTYNSGTYAAGVDFGTATNCIVYYNNYSSVAFSYSCTTPLPLGGVGNFTNEPGLFADNIHLLTNSPCIGAGTYLGPGTDIDGNPWADPPSVGCSEWQPIPYVGNPQVQLTSNPIGFNLSAAATGAGPPSYLWLQNGVPLQNNGHFSSTQTTDLIVTGVYYTDVGSYQLVVSNSFGVVTSAVAQVIHCVDAAGTNPIAPYFTWATAATNIQDAITSANIGEIVLVTNGLYAFGGISMDGTITNRVSLNEAILVQSLNGPNRTTIQGALDPNSVNGPGAIRCAWLTNNAILSGFTLSGGATRSVTSSPNETMEGGGVFGVSTSALVNNCLIVTNFAGYIGGGAIQVTLNQCTLAGNQAVGSGTPGNGVADAGSGGGAANCNLTDCYVKSNIADQSSGGGAQNCNLVNCALMNNLAYLYGGGAYEGLLVNCTVANNTSGGYGGDYGGAVAGATLTNCIVYDNIFAGIPGFGGSTNYLSSSFSYCDTDPLPSGAGNIDVNPQFIADGLHLSESSPCIGAGTFSVVSGTDIDGQSWDNPPSIGCDQWQPATVICGPPTYQVNLAAYSLTFNVIVAGQPPFVFFWSKDGSPIQDDADHTNSGTANPVVENFQSADAGLYQVVVSNAFNVATSSVVTVTVDYPPGITVQPDSVAVTNGGSANFSVTVVGAGLFAYQWYLNNTAEGSDTNASLPIINASPVQAGNYYCVITNDYGSVTSRVATLTIALPPSIIMQPTNQIAYSGSNAVLSVDVSGTGPFTYQWQFNGTNLPNNIIKTVAGDGEAGFSGDGRPATNAELHYPNDAVLDSFGNLFIADESNNRVRKVDINGVITTVAGGGTNYPGDGGAATNAQLASPADVVMDANGDLFIADEGYNRIRKVNPNGIITTVAGTNFAGFSGDGGPAIVAQLNSPVSVAVDSSGNLFISDKSNQRIRKVDTNGIITTVAGTNSAGYSGDGGPATNARLNFPSGVTVDAFDNIFIGDENNNRIRKVDTNGIITTVAGKGIPTYSGDGGPATNASISFPQRLSLDGAGNLYIGDQDNQRIREVLFGGTPTLTLSNLNLNNAGHYSVLVSNPYGSVTSSNVSLVIIIPPKNFTASMATGAGLQLQFSGTPSYPYILETATNLAPPVAWQPIVTNCTDTNGDWSFTDTNINQYLQRFYRASP